MPTPTNFTTIDAILQKDIRPAIESQLQEKALLWRVFRGFQSSMDGDSYTENRVVGEGAMETEMRNNKLYFPILTGRTGGATAVSANNEVVYGNVPLQQGVVNLVTNTGAFLITEQILQANGVVTDAFSMSMEQTANSMAADANRQAYSDGSAILATTAGTGTSTQTLVLTASKNGDIDYADYLPVNTQIQIGANAPVVVTAVTGLNTVTISAAQTWASGANVVKLDGSNAVAVEFVGLGAMIGTGPYGGVTAGSWSSYVDTNGGTNKVLTTADMDKAFLKSARTGRPNLVIMNATEYSKYAASLTVKQQFQADKTLFGGWTALTYMGDNATVVLDYDCPDDRIYILSTDELYYSELKALDWLPGEKGALRGIPKTLNYEAICSFMGAIWTPQRNAHAVLTNRVG